MYKKILIPVENSDTDKTILDHIKPLARLCSSHLVLVHVADGFVARNQSRMNLSDSEEMKKDRDYLTALAEAFKKDGFHVDTELLCGEPAEQILKLSEKLKCDLIAMATHGHGFISDIVLGSVAENIRHRTTTPILMVKAE